jgi:hypothetical protein
MTHRAGFVGLPPRDTSAARLQREALVSLPRHQDFSLEPQNSGCNPQNRPYSTRSVESTSLNEAID